MRRSATPAEPAPASAYQSATPAEPAPASAYQSATRCAAAAGSRLWAFVGMLLVMAGAMVGLGLTG